MWLFLAAGGCFLCGYFQRSVDVSCVVGKTVICFQRSLRRRWMILTTNARVDVDGRLMADLVVHTLREMYLSLSKSRVIHFRSHEGRRDQFRLVK
jgi:hypothetical protein